MNKTHKQGPPLVVALPKARTRAHSPTPIQTGILLFDPKYDTKMTVMTLPISYMEEMTPVSEEGIS